MSQNDFNIANQGFPSFRSDMNSALQALASNSAGATEPATTYAYQWWYDSTNEVLKIRNADNDAWIDFAVFDQATDTWSLGSLVVDGNFVVDTDTLVVDSTNHRVSIGTASSAFPFHVNAGTANTAAMFESEDANASIYLIDSGTTGGTSASHGLLTSGDELAVRAVDHFIVETGTTERVRVNDVGDLLVAKTNGVVSTVGHAFMSTGQQRATVDGDITAIHNRLTSNGDFIQFRQDGTTIFKITNIASSLRMSIAGTNGSNGSGIYFSNGALLPADHDGTLSDNYIDFGTSSYRYDNIYATNGTIQTSDANEKQQIAELTAAEMEAAKAISKLFKTFKWNSSVAEKGDAARIHSGVIAQEVEAAMTDAGIDAGKYGFFCSDTWWEADGETYETAEEAPEGAVERTRKGIRYPQLLSFIGAATEQRLASIEARLDAAGM